MARSMKSYTILCRRSKEFRPGFIEYALYPFHEEIATDEAELISSILCSLHGTEEREFSAIVYMDHIHREQFVRILRQEYRNQWTLEHRRAGITIFRATIDEKLVALFVHFIWRMLVNTDFYVPISFSRLREREKRYFVEFCTNKMSHKFPLSLLLNRMLFDQFFPIVVTWGHDGNELIVGCEFSVRERVLERIQKTLKHRGIPFTSKNEVRFTIFEE